MLPCLPVYSRYRYPGRCPGCALQNRIEAEDCEHCGRVFSKEDQVQILTYANAQKRKGIRMGLYMGVVLLVILLIILVLQ